MIPRACSLLGSQRAASRSFFAAAILGLLTACGGEVGSTDTATAAATTPDGNATAPAIAPKYVAGNYTATPIVAPDGILILTGVHLAEGGHIAGFAIRPGARYQLGYYWTIAGGFREVTGAVVDTIQVNDAGFVVTSVPEGRGYRQNFPLSWSPDSGQRNPLPYEGVGASVIGVSNGATVIGTEVAADYIQNRPVYWRADGSHHQLALPGSEAAAFVAINRQEEAVGNYGSQPFVWTEASGVSLVVLPANVTRAVATSIGAGGHVAGYAEMADGGVRPFVWRSDAGFQLVEVDIGGRGNAFSYQVSAGGALISSAQHNSRPIYWSPGVGLRDLIGEAGASGQALSISPDGTVVGWYKGADERQRAFVWTPVTGLIDLNTLLPAGQNLHLESAYQNTDGGHIVAIANGNPFLLAPADTPSPPSHPPIVEDIEGPDVVNVATDFTVSARFTDADVGDQHDATWAWADGSEVDIGTITASDGGYRVTGSHRYATAGVHEITLTVNDSRGNQVTTSRKITVVDSAAGQVLGAGHFVSAPGALKSRPDLAGRAEIAFVVRHDERGETPYGALAFRLRAAELVFRATDFATLNLSDNRALFTGTGAVNGAEGYPFSLELLGAASAQDKARVRLLITAPDGSVHYDNQPAAGSEAGDPVGVALTGGTVQIRAED